MINIDHIIEAAKAGGEICEKYFGQVLDTEEKTAISDFRTKADTESEDAILAVLKEKYPDYNIYSEETGETDNKSEFTFIVDPLDGSNNFVLGIPNFSVSIALLRENEVIAGVTYLPMLHHVYYAEKGKGAFVNGERIEVNDESEIKKSTVSYTCGYLTDRTYMVSLKDKLNNVGIKRLLDNWSPAVDFALVASGKFEAVINNNNEIYDYVAGKIIAREAGAKITDFNGNIIDNDREPQFLLSNGAKVHEELLTILKEI